MCAAEVSKPRGPGRLLIDPAEAFAPAIARARLACRVVSEQPAARHQRDNRPRTSDTDIDFRAPVCLRGPIQDVRLSPERRYTYYPNAREPAKARFWSRLTDSDIGESAKSLLSWKDSVQPDVISDAQVVRYPFGRCLDSLQRTYSLCLQHDRAWNGLKPWQQVSMYSFACIAPLRQIVHTIISRGACYSRCRQGKSRPEGDVGCLPR